MAQSLDRRNFLRYSLLAGGAAGSAALLAACGGSDSSGAPSSKAANEPGGPINVQLSWIKNIEFAGEYFALEKGYYKEAGYDVTLVAGGSATTGVETGLTAKKVYTGMTAPMLTAPAILAGAQLKTIATTFQKNPFAIVSAKSKPLNTPADMKGKKIGVQDSNTAVFGALLAANGLSATDVQVVSVQFDPTPLTTGEVDGWVSYVTNEPITLAAKGFENTNFLFADHGLPLVAETFVVRQDTIDTDRANLKKFLIAEIKGWTDAVANPQESARLAVEKYGKDQNLELDEQIKEATAQNDLVVSDDTKKNGLLTISDELVAQNIEALGKANLKITADQLFDLSLIKEVYEENPDLIK